MAQQVDVVEHYWGWCSKYYIPYPCRKTRTVKKWCYEFSYLTVDYHGVYTNYVGCEFNVLYSWRAWELTFRFEAFTLYFLTKCYSTQRPSAGSCSNDLAISYLKKTLGPDLKRVLLDDEPDSGTRGQASQEVEGR